MLYVLVCVWLCMGVEISTLYALVCGCLMYGCWDFYVIRTGMWLPYVWVLKFLHLVCGCLTYGCWDLYVVRTGVWLPYVWVLRFLRYTYWYVIALCMDVEISPLEYGTSLLLDVMLFLRLFNFVFIYSGLNFLCVVLASSVMFYQNYYEIESAYTIFIIKIHFHTNCHI